MKRSQNAELAVEAYKAIHKKHKLKPKTAWQGIARLLLTCEISQGNTWQTHEEKVVVFRESNYFRQPDTPVIRRSKDLTDYLANELGIKRHKLCEKIGAYWRNPRIEGLQRNNLLGNAFRSLTVHILKTFGNDKIEYTEEVSPYEAFNLPPNHKFPTRSDNPKIDIVARKNGSTVALISARWRYRHDRVDIVEEVKAYTLAAQEHNEKCRFYAFVGEFVPARLKKILNNCSPAVSEPVLDAAVHFEPKLVTHGLYRNDTKKQEIQDNLNDLKSLKWLIKQTESW